MLVSTSSFTSSPLALAAAALLGILCIFGVVLRTSNSSYGASPSSSFQDPSVDFPSIPGPRLDSHIQGVHKVIDPSNPDADHDGKAANARPDRLPKPSGHAIDDLVAGGRAEVDSLLGAPAGKDVAEAARIYRERRGRHPPPGFEKWFVFAQDKNALVAETMFDQIYHDLEPFWGLEPLILRLQAEDWPFMFVIRDGTVRARNARPVAGEWVGLWEGMLNTIVKDLPDMDIPFNHLDEPRMIVPWEDMNDLMSKAQETRSVEKPESKESVVTTYPQRVAHSLNVSDIGMTGLAPDGPWLNTETMWNLARRACPPGSKARDTAVDDDCSTPPTIPRGLAANSYFGFVKNWTATKDVCQHPHLANMHGTFVSPRYVPVNTTLRPIFSGCKIAGVSNEIVLPAAKYFSEEEDFSFSGKASPWASKEDGVFWRGQATGGAHNGENWKRFHRHRFVAMLNGSLVTQEERITRPQHRATADTGEVKGAYAGIDPNDPNAHSDGKLGLPHNFPLPKDDKNAYNMSALATRPVSTVGAWLASKTDVGFDHLMCDPWKFSIMGDGKQCGYLDRFYSAVDRVNMSDMFDYKYLPDIDGNSYSGRYRAYLRSGSVPLKATIWSEWHDSRLVPWAHFVPLDNTYTDLWAVLEYFWGYGSGADDEFEPGAFREAESRDESLHRRSHDDVAASIARTGSEWADRALRTEDMAVYAYRLLLEYARLVADERAHMDYVEDLF